MLVGLPGAKPSISGLRLGPVSSVTRTDSGFTCTLPNGETIQMIEPSTTSIEGTAGVPLGCNKAPSASEVTATEGGAVVWGRPSTIVVTCKESYTRADLSTQAEISLTIAMTPCPGRGTSQCR
jgi:hypothetical protein